MLFYIGIVSCLYVSLGTVIIVCCLRAREKSTEDIDQQIKVKTHGTEKQAHSCIDKKYLRLTNRRGTTVF